MDRYEQLLTVIERTITKRESVMKQKVTETNADSKISREWTLTQLHIVDIINTNEVANNRMLSDQLAISKPAVTKAVKKLMSHYMLIEVELANNKKESYYALTEKGKQLAQLHEQLHEKARRKYIEIFEEFSDTELEVIQRFFEVLIKRI